MAAEIRNFAVQIPAGTPIAAPVTIAMPMPARVVESIRWRVPEGHFGQVGWALAMSGVKIIPWDVTQWIVANDESDEVSLSDYPDSGAWQLIGYNLGIYPHTVYVTFKLLTLGSSVVAVVSAPLHIAATPAAVVSVAVTSATAPATVAVTTPQVIAPAY